YGGPARRSVSWEWGLPGEAVTRLGGSGEDGQDLRASSGVRVADPQRPNTQQWRAPAPAPQSLSVRCDSESHSPRGRAAFTLIELLTVISIIGIVAGLIIGLAPGATRAMHNKRVEGDLQQLLTAIEQY